MSPRLNSFEISHKGYLIFSRLGGKYWPACDLVAKKCATVAFHEPHNCDMGQWLAGMGIGKDGIVEPSKKRIGVDENDDP